MPSTRLDTRTVVKDYGGWREFSGRKSFCSGRQRFGNADCLGGRRRLAASC